jgi:predicted CxxxxCH...CXXCH cytochrome family protein
MTACVVGWALLATGCSGTPPQKGATAAAGQSGVSFKVVVAKPLHGTVTSSDGQIRCGTTGDACSAVYAWSASAVLTATPDEGFGLRTWAGDCSLTGPCVLDTTRYGADKYVLAAFDPVGSLGHGNWTSPALHAPAYRDFVSGAPGSLQCTSCHGADLQGVGIAVSCSSCHAWGGGGGTLACGSCHALPPATGHPVVAADLTGCVSCHPATMNTDGTVNAAGGRHLDGVVDVAGGTSCTSCHGDATRTLLAGADPDAKAAPPVDTHGNTAPAARGVGAHQAHLGASALARPIACAECHVVPSSTGHANGTAEVAFGAIARTGGATAAWTGATCATYCHGGTLGGGTNTDPSWTGGADEAACGACHGLPPPAPHVQNASCGSCHPGYGPTSVNPATHVDGQLQVTGAATCTSCHGDAARTPVAGADPNARAAPPVDASGQTSTTARGVGAHQAHVSAGPESLSPPIACAECHVVPSSTSHSDGAVNVTFGAKARTGGASPSWNGTSCATSYCHGATLAGGTNQAPSWIGGASQAACGTCHGSPPPAPHVQSTGCGACHAGYTASTVNWAVHVDGQVQVSAASCTSCHGDASRVGVAGADPNLASAPPMDTAGNTASTARGVGAHQAHLNTGTGAIARPLACSECHLVPTATAHSDGTALVTFGALARTGGVTPQWNGSSCATSYCHGATLPGGGTIKTPTWTAGPSQAACGTCHGSPPSTGEHGRHSGRSCGDCHGGTYTRTAADASRHVNGAVEIGNRITSWNPATRTCTVSCHGQEVW